MLANARAQALVALASSPPVLANARAQALLALASSPPVLAAALVAAPAPNAEQKFCASSNPFVFLREFFLTITLILTLTEVHLTLTEVHLTLILTLNLPHLVEYSSGDPQPGERSFSMVRTTPRINDLKYDYEKTMTSPGGENRFPARTQHQGRLKPCVSRRV